MSASDDLHHRSGLPEALRGLLAEHPRSDWAAHAHFEGLVAFWLDRHGMFRELCQIMTREAERAADGALALPELQRGLARHGGMLVQQLHGHHQIEDLHYFPVLTRREPRLARGFEILDRDHHALDALLAGFAEDANAVLQGRLEPGAFRERLLGFEAVLVRHLEDEEDLIVPVILKHGPGGLG
jgi:hemerythrin-like domain-containing protein